MRNHHPIRSSLARFPALIAVATAFALLAATAASAGDQTANAGNPAASPANPTPPSGNVVYKWKDAHGISQYSQQPPPKGVKFDIIENSGASSAGDNPSQATDPNNPKN